MSMEGLTCTLSWTLDVSSVLGTKGRLMLLATTQMYRLHEEHQRKVGTTLRKMEKLSQGDSSDQLEAQFLELAISGARSSLRNLENDFGNLWRNWLRACSLRTSTLSKHLPSTDFGRNLMDTTTQESFNAALNTYHSSAGGFMKTWSVVESETMVSLTPLRGGTPRRSAPSAPLVPRWLAGGPHPPFAGALVQNSSLDIFKKRCLRNQGLGESRSCSGDQLDWEKPCGLDHSEIMHTLGDCSAWRNQSQTRPDTPSSMTLED